MNAGTNTIEPTEGHYLHADIVESTSLLASPAVRIWLTLLLVMFGLGGLGGFTQLAEAVATLERSNLSGLFTALTSITALTAFSIGHAASTPSRSVSRVSMSQRPMEHLALPARPSQSNAGQTTSAQPSAANDAGHEQVPEDKRQLPIAELGENRSGPRWLLAIDNLLTRKASRRTVIATVALTSAVSAFVTWRWVGNIGETVTALIGVAVLAALFSRLTQTAAQNRQVANDLRSTNNRLVQEIVARRGRDQAAARETGATEQYPLAMDFGTAALHDLEALRTKFLNEVSHELRGPITAINLAARIIMKHHEYDHDVVERFGSTIVVEGDRLAHIVNEFLELAKIESGCVKWSEDIVDPAEIVTSAIFANEAVAGERGVELTPEVEPGLPPINADRDRIVQALTILISTALRTTPDNGKLIIHARGVGTETLFAVEDDCSEIIETKSFNIFGGVKKVKTQSDGKDNGGHGLGLCIASEIAAHYGGDTWAEGREGKDAAFLLSIPNERRAAKTSRGDDSGADSADGSGGSADDENENPFQILEATTPKAGDATAPVLLDPTKSAVLPSVFAPLSGEVQTADSLGDTPPVTPDADDARSVSISNDADAAPAEMADSLGSIATDGDDAAAESWGREFEQPFEAEKLSMQELDDMLYGRTGIFSIDDDDDDESEAAATRREFAAVDAAAPHADEKLEAGAAPVCDSLGAIEDTSQPTNTSSRNAPTNSAFDEWLAEGQAAQEGAHDAFESTSVGDSLEDALAQLGRSTATLTAETIDAPESLAALAASSGRAEDHSRAARTAATSSPRAAKHDPRKQQSGWQLASGIGASLVRKTPPRR